MSADNESEWWWLSFCDADKPTGTQFLGACVVQATDELAAVAAAHRAGINPGGEVAIAGPIPADRLPPKQPLWRLLSRAEIDAVDDAIDAREATK